MRPLGIPSRRWRTGGAVGEDVAGLATVDAELVPQPPLTFSRSEGHSPHLHGLGSGG